jgi:hypothetical protein
MDNMLEDGENGRQCNNLKEIVYIRYVKSESLTTYSVSKMVENQRHFCAVLVRIQNVLVSMENGFPVKITNVDIP